jgi:competence protein ComEC
LLLCIQLSRLYDASGQQKLYVYKSHKTTLLDFMDGQQLYSLRDSSLNPNKIGFISKNNHIANRILNRTKTLQLHQDSINSPSFYISKEGIGSFGDFSFAIPNKALLENAENREKPLKVDFLVLTGNPRLKNLELLENLFDYRMLVFDASNSSYRLMNWRRQCTELTIPFIDCSEKGQELLRFLKPKTKN